MVVRFVPGTMESGLPPRERARSLVQESEMLVNRLFEMVEAHTSGRMGKDGSSPEIVMDSLIEKQEELKAVLLEILEQQEVHQAMEQVRRVTTEQDEKLARFMAGLRAAEGALQEALDQTKGRVAALHRSNMGLIDINDIVSYAGKISSSIAAPPNWDPSLPLGNYLPPAPTEEMMRAGRLG